MDVVPFESRPRRCPDACSPTITFDSVVLPEPDGPITAVNVAGLAENEIWSSQCAIAFDRQADVAHRRAHRS